MINKLICWIWGHKTVEYTDVNPFQDVPRPYVPWSLLTRGECPRCGKILVKQKAVK